MAMFEDLPSRYTIALVALGGLLLGLSFPGYLPVDSPLAYLPGLLAWVGLVPWLLVIGRTGNWRTDFWHSLTLGIAFEAVLNYWLLAMHPLTWLGIPYLMSILVVLVCWGGVAGVFGVGIALAGTGYGYLVRRFLASGRSASWLPLLAAAFQMALEWAQTQGELAYPWGVLAVSQVTYLPLLQLLPLGGPYLLSGLVAGFNASVAEGMRGDRRPLLVSASAVILALIYGQWALRPSPVGTIPVAAVQGALSSEEKWSPGMVDATTTRYLALSAQAPQARLVVWPESAIPIVWNNGQSPQSAYAVARLRAAFREPDRYLLSGAFFFAPKSSGSDVDFYNAATVIGTGQLDWRWESKRHLVPFGEFLPGRGILPDVLAKLNVLTHDISRGDGPHPFVLHDLGRQGPAGGRTGVTIGTGVCFDSIFPRALASDVAAGATLLAVVTNDAWYKDTAAPHQHFAQSILRAVENHRFLIRAANTGVSGIIDPYGRVLKRSRVFVPAVVEGKVAPLTAITPYTRWGDWPLVPGGVILVLGLLLGARRTPRELESGDQTPMSTAEPVVNG